MLINPVNLYMGGPGLTPLPHPGGFSCRGPSRPRLCPERRPQCWSPSYRDSGLLLQVTRATVLARLLYAASACRRFATAQDCSRIDRFINRAFNLGYLLADCHTFNSLVNMAENSLLSSVIRNSYHVLRPLIPPILSCTRRNGLRKRAHPFTIPLL